MTRLWQTIRLLIASLRFIRDPKQLDEVLSISRNLNNRREVHRWVEFLKTQPRESAAFQSRPLIGAVDLQALATLPNGTLGHEYADFLIRRGFTPDDIHFDAPAEMRGSEEDYVLQYLYETHDLYHVMTGFDTDLTGELGLQAYYASKNVSVFPVFILALGLLNTVFFDREHKDARLSAIAEGWRLGRTSQNLFGLQWTSLWRRPLTELRAEFGIVS